MNANLFDVMERGYEAAREMQRSKQADADEAFTMACQRIENELATNYAAVLDIVGEILGEADLADAITALFVVGRHEHAEGVITARIKTEISLRANREQVRREKQAREDAEADRYWYGEN